MLPPRTRRCSSSSTVSSGASPSSSLVDMSAASPDNDPGPPPAPNVSFTPPATRAVSASMTPRSTRRKACTFLFPMLFVSFRGNKLQCFSAVVSTRAALRQLIKRKRHGIGRMACMNTPSHSLVRRGICHVARVRPREPNHPRSRIIEIHVE
jgi:hypothetical protein